MKYTRTFWAVLIGLSSSLMASAQADSIAEPVVVDTVPLEDDPYLVLLDSMLVATYANHFSFDNDSVHRLPGSAAEEVSVFDATGIEAGLEELNKWSPMELTYNETVLSYIELYAVRRKGTTSRMMGMAETYYPMFEQIFDKYDIPYELKHLAVVESALNPAAKSHAGAMGLWQFMNATGRSFGLEVNSLIDERMDPIKSTEAACKYLNYLHNMYDDWNLALAAYNSGPGNVNKAIRRSGGKRDFWAIKRYLPRETQGYVPAFIAVNYVMNHGMDHGIYPTAPEYSYFELDTVCVSQSLRFDHIAQFVDLTEEEIAQLNPCYKRGIIPGKEGYNNIYLTVACAGEFIVNEEKIYAFVEAETEEEAAEAEELLLPGKEVIYKVRSGDVLGVIAERHGVSLSDLKAWNNIRGNRIYPGQKLTIYVKEGNEPKPNPKPKPKPETTDDGNYQYHTVRKGDTLWDIAKLYEGVSTRDLEQLNAGINVKNLKQGQKIKIRKL